MSNVVKFRMAKSITVETEGKTWTKKNLALVVQLPDKSTDAQVQQALAHAEYMIDTFLGQPELPQIPHFNPDLLMKHEWKGKKTGEGTYSPGSLSWGWDFADKLPKEVLDVLGKGPMTIDQYEFTLDGHLVNTKKIKK